MTATLAGTWSAFCRELDTGSGWLYREFAACRQDCDALLQAQVRELGLYSWRPPPRESLVSLEEFVASAGSALLFQPLLTLKKVRPELRTLAVVEACDKAVKTFRACFRPGSKFRAGSCQKVLQNAGPLQHQQVLGFP